jgi:hypothetical protein
MGVRFEFSSSSYDIDVVGIKNIVINEEADSPS